jgi:hypothetical protein
VRSGESPFRSRGIEKTPHLSDAQVDDSGRSEKSTTSKEVASAEVDRTHTYGSHGYVGQERYNRPDPRADMDLHHRDRPDFRDKPAGLEYTTKQCDTR